MDTKVLKALLDSYPYPVVFVDTEHIIRFLNRRAEKNYYQDRKYENLIGKSIFDCHNANSKAVILEVFEKLKKGEDEVFEKINKRNERVYITAVRDESGTLLGYFERMESNITK